MFTSLLEYNYTKSIQLQSVVLQIHTDCISVGEVTLLPLQPWLWQEFTPVPVCTTHPATLVEGRQINQHTQQCLLRPSWWFLLTTWKQIIEGERYVLRPAASKCWLCREWKWKSQERAGGREGSGKMYIDSFVCKALQDCSNYNDELLMTCTEQIIAEQ